MQFYLTIPQNFDQQPCCHEKTVLDKFLAGQQGVIITKLSYIDMYTENPWYLIHLWHKQKTKKYKIYYNRKYPVAEYVLEPYVKSTLDMLDRYHMIVSATDIMELNSAACPFRYTLNLRGK